MRINVTGNAGAGKTTVAKRIGELLGLRVFHLDSIVWQPNWQKTPEDSRTEMENSLISRHSWVIDGVSNSAREKADLVIVLDFPLHICFTRALKRSVRYLFRSRLELPASCPEILILPTLIKIILRYPKQVRTKILREANNSSKYRIINSDDSLRNYLASLT